LKKILSKEIDLGIYGIKLIKSGGNYKLKSSKLFKALESAGFETSCDVRRTIEDLILFHANAGVDITSPGYISGIKGIVEAWVNGTLEDL
jgi:hypothetical protein